MLLDITLSESDRAKFGGPETLILDTDRLMDQPAHMLIRWETEAGYAIERAIGELARGQASAQATMVLVWLARKQMGADGGGVGDDGQPESIAELAELRTMRVSIRAHQGPLGDANPPAQLSAQPSESAG